MQKDTFVFMFLVFIYFRKTAHCCVSWNLQNSVPGGHGTVLPSCTRPVELPGAGYWVLTGKEFYKTLSIIGAYQKQSSRMILLSYWLKGDHRMTRKIWLKGNQQLGFHHSVFINKVVILSQQHSEIPCINVHVYQEFYFIVFIPLLQRRRGNY